MLLYPHASSPWRTRLSSSDARDKEHTAPDVHADVSPWTPGPIARHPPYALGRVACAPQDARSFAAVASPGPQGQGALHDERSRGVPYPSPSHSHLSVKPQCLWTWRSERLPCAIDAVRGADHDRPPDHKNGPWPSQRLSAKPHPPRRGYGPSNPSCHTRG